MQNQSQLHEDLQRTDNVNYERNNRIIIKFPFPSSYLSLFNKFENEQMFGPPNANHTEATKWLKYVEHIYLDYKLLFFVEFSHTCIFCNV